VDDLVLSRVEDVSWSIRTVAEVVGLSNVVGTAIRDYGEVLAFPISPPFFDLIMPSLFRVR
jgi:hypothetical protein